MDFSTFTINFSKKKILIFLFCIFGTPLEITTEFRRMFFKHVKTGGVGSHPNIHHIWVINKYM